MKIEKKKVETKIIKIIKTPKLFRFLLVFSFFQFFSYNNSAIFGNLFFET